MTPIDWIDRDFLPMPDEMAILERIAALPRNHKRAKGALFLVMYVQGYSKDAICEELRVSERSLERWFQRWVDDDLDGLMFLDAISIERVFADIRSEFGAGVEIRARAAVATVRLDFIRWKTNGVSSSVDSDAEKNTRLENA